MSANRSSRASRLTLPALAVAFSLFTVLLTALPATAAEPQAAPATGVRARILEDLRQKDPATLATLEADYGKDLAALAPALGKVTITEAELARQLDAFMAYQLYSGANPQEMEFELQKFAAAVAAGKSYSASGAAAGLGAPTQEYSDFFPACDLNGDGAADMVVDNFDWVFANFLESGFFSQKESVVRALDGNSSATLWRYELGGYTPFVPVPPLTSDNDGSDFYPAPFRSGMPNPVWSIAPWDVFKPAGDLNGDNVCDFLGFGYKALMPLTPFVILVGVWWSKYDGKLVALDGAKGDEIWEVPINGDIKSVFPPPIPCAFVPCPNYEVYMAVDYPTGWAFTEAPGGPRLVWKTTDINYQRQQGQQQRLTQENIQYIDARTGRDLWSTMIPNPDTGVQVITWLSGTGYLVGEEEPDIVLDDATVFAAGRVTALFGELDRSGAQIWQNPNIFVPLNQGQGRLAEGPIEVYMWQYTYVVDDITGDGSDDVIATYLVGPPQGKFPINEDYKTHFHPLQGRTGAKIWGVARDVKYQGWGFLEDLNGVENQTQPYVAIGTVDVATPKLPGSRFIPKFSRIVVLSADTAEAHFVYRERYGLDSYFSYDLALRQLHQGIAPRDVNGDGVRDPISPSRYQAPSGAVQVLVGNMQHDYVVLDAVGGDLLFNVTAWGPQGAIYTCRSQDPSQVTILSGHGRRIDLTRVRLEDGNVTWRQSLFYNPAPQSPTAGTELLFVAGRCGDEADNRTMIGFSLGMASLRRGFSPFGGAGYEVIAPHGFLDTQYQLDWLKPNLMGDPPMNASIDYLFEPAKPLGTGPKIGIAAVPFIPGFLGGFGYSLFRIRRKGGGLE